MTLNVISVNPVGLIRRIGKQWYFPAGLAFAISVGALQPLILAQGPTPELSSAVGKEMAARLIRWTGTLPESAGKTVEVRFAIYENAAGGLLIWNESQSVAVSADGHYSVLLGANTAEGLPPTLFPPGEPRWVEAIAVADLNKQDRAASEAPRSLLAAVPYAFSSVDAESLAGRAAADYVTHEDLKSFAAGIVLPSETTAGISGAGAVGPNIAGTGTTNALALWTNSTTLGNSVMSQSGTKIGINTTTPGATLDVHGNTTLRGTLYFPAEGSATSSTGYNSQLLEMANSTYSSTAGEPVSANFAWQNTVFGNNTSSPTGTLDLLYATGANSLAQTGLSFAANGKINFATGQTFPGTGTITGITTTSPLSGSGTSGSVALSLNTATLETTLNGKYPQLATANTLTGANTFAGTVTGNSTGTSYAIEGNTTAGVGVLGNATTGFGVEGITTAANDNYAAVFGQNGGGSGMLTFIRGFDDVSAGVWGDSAASSTASYSIGVIGTADNTYAGYFLNDSDAYPTIYLDSQGSGGKTNSVSKTATNSMFKTLMAVTPDGTCGFGSGGSLTCTGQIKSLVSTRAGERNVETYSMQSPENWMEDFGDAELHNGSAIITIDPDFAETASATAKYHVFLTPRGDSKGLYVTNLTATSFEVRESGGGTASIAFDYRIVGKRRGFEKQRLTDVTESYHKEMADSQRMKKGAKPVEGVRP